MLGDDILAFDDPDLSKVVERVAQAHRAGNKVILTDLENSLRRGIIAASVGNLQGELLRLAA